MGLALSLAVLRLTDFNLMGLALTDRVEVTIRPAAHVLHFWSYTFLRFLTGWGFDSAHWVELVVLRLTDF